MSERLFVEVAIFVEAAMAFPRTRWRCRDRERFSNRDEGYRPSCVLSIAVTLINMVGRLG